MILAILQARASSRRLPGKVLKPILGRPMLALQLERVGRAQRIDRLLVATSLDPSDDPIATLCRDLGVGCFRGSLDDVLDRFYQAAAEQKAASVVRLTGDCPLADPAVIDRVVGIHTGGGYDYTSNVLRRTYPDGLDVEMVRFACLEVAWREAQLPSEREHVMPFVNRRPDRFKLHDVTQPNDLSHWRWVVDEPEDFAFITRIYEALYPANPAFTTADVLGLLRERPDIAAMMGRAKTNEGYEKSLAADAAYLADHKEQT
jgi:spore coat polysaccharide biosynthesis protein SpsF